MLEEQKAEAQQALDDLFSHHLLPFKLSARKVEPIGREEYIVRFYDSRLHSVAVPWRMGECFENVVREAVLARVERINGAWLEETAA